MKGVVIGSGFGLIHAQNIKHTSGLELIGIVPGRRQSYAGERISQLGLNIIADLDDVIQLKPDFVTIATPPSTHREIALKFLDHGIATVIEKPLSERDDFTRELSGARALATVYYQWRFHPAIEIAQQLCAKALAPTRISLTFRHHFLAGRETQWAWRHNPLVAGSGVLADLGVHLVDLLFWLTEQDFTPVKVSSGVVHSTRIYSEEEIEGRTEDYLQIEAAAAGNGTSAIINVDRTVAQHNEIVLEISGAEEVVKIRINTENGEWSMGSTVHTLTENEQPARRFYTELAKVLKGGQTFKLPSLDQISKVHAFSAAVQSQIKY
ncbi:Gfo/Idh/MocA family protein [Rhizobium leguminosarum]|uniref:Gfo/Idh/MocA family protein n=1 Tax=Rhizobium leguminosarum TaxID=384 RepID=UPI001F1D91A1|nr:Gfo/Idh/MocA family oxidoreductase [Rhizobium leguminosarum]UIJ83182.1 Gfo/Idh/MocA family oxidoreductase [Rhizobium leguminosarum]